MAYSEKRLKLDQHGIYIRVGRTKLNPEKHEITESKNTVYKSRPLNKNEVKKIREQYTKDFPNSVTDIMKYKGIDQGSEGACGFVSLLNLRQIYRKPITFKRIKWPAAYRRMLTCENGNMGFEDIASMLDAFKKKFEKMQWLNGLVYFPLRSRGSSEMNYNKLLFTETQREQKKIAYVTAREQIRLKIENLLETGKAVQINMGEHSRVAVAFNNKDILFADSWNTAFEQNSPDGLDKYAAGFSVVPKYHIYDYARDISYYDEPTSYWLQRHNVHSEPKQESSASPNQPQKKRRSRRSTKQTQKTGKKQKKSGARRSRRLKHKKQNNGLHSLFSNLRF